MVNNNSFSPSLVKKIFSGHNIEFFAGAQSTKHLPDYKGKEVVFVGRSNVGKSSLINKLFNRKGVARVSKSPGCTRQINVFYVKDRMYVVDVPGYGYARVSASQSLGWDKMMVDYFSGRQENIACVFVLVDARRGIGTMDAAMVEFLEGMRIHCQIVYTKMDKLKVKELSELQEQHNVFVENNHTEYLLKDFMSISSRTGSSIDSLQCEMLRVCE